MNIFPLDLKFIKSVWEEPPQQYYKKIQSLKTSGFNRTEQVNPSFAQVSCCMIKFKVHILSCIQNCFPKILAIYLLSFGHSCWVKVKLFASASLWNKLFTLYSYSWSEKMRQRLLITMFIINFIEPNFISIFITNYAIFRWWIGRNKIITDSCLELWKWKSEVW